MSRSTLSRYLFLGLITAAFIPACNPSSDPLPCNGDDCETPCTGDGCEIPCTGDDCETPCTGDDCEIPCTGDDCEIPCTGDDCEIPCTGDDCEIPCTGDDCEIPCTGDDCETLDPDSVCLTQWRQHIGDADAWMKPSSDSVSGQGRALSGIRFMDVNDDGCGDFVFGVGWEDSDVPGHPYALGEAKAIDGVTMTELWSVSTRGEVFGSARTLHDANGDLLLVFSGRDGTLVAVHAQTGIPAWTFDAACFGGSVYQYGLYNPIVVEDVNGDGVEDLVTTLGGDPVFAPGEIRPHSFVVLVSGSDGSLLGARPTPDGAETYSSPSLWRREPTHVAGNAGSRFIFGTGGETRPGAVFRGSVSDLIGYNACTTDEDNVVVPWGEQLTDRVTDKGVISPTTIADINVDGYNDLLVQYFDGTLVLLAGTDDDGFAPPLLFSPQAGSMSLESNHAPTVGKMSDGSYRVGTVHNHGIFPSYISSSVRVLSASLTQLRSGSSFDHGFAASPLSADIDNDGNDDFLFFMSRLFFGPEETYMVFMMGNGEEKAHTIEHEGVGASPAVFRAEGHRRGEMAVVSFFVDEASMIHWKLQRYSLNHDIARTQTWPEYLGPCADSRLQCERTTP